MANWQPWQYPGHWNIEEHNAVLAALRKAEAEVERMGRANNDACDKIAELETLNDALVKDLNFYRDEYQPVSAARDAAEARVQELEAECKRWIAENNRLVNECADARQRIAELEAEHTEAFARIAELEAALPQPEDIAGLYRVPELQARVRELEAQLAAVPRVDPEAWKTEIQIRCATCADEDWLRMSTIPGKVSIIISEAGSACVSNMIPADAARAAVWLASYAQAHGAPVDLGTTVPASQSVEERFGKFLDSGVGGGDDEYLVDAYLRGYSEVTGKSPDSISYSRTGIGYVRDAVLAGVAQPAPIATPETLEALARLGWDAWHKDAGCNDTDETTWEINKPHEIAAATAILRAARPTVDVTWQELLSAYNAHSSSTPFSDKYKSLLALCNSRIRYGVAPALWLEPEKALREMPADATIGVKVTHTAPTDAQIEALARVLRSTYLPPKGVLTHWEKTCDASRDEWRDVSRAAYEYFGGQVTELLDAIDALIAERDAYDADLDRVTAERDELRRQHQTDGEWIGDTEPNEDDVAKAYTEDDSIFSHELYEMIRNKTTHTPVERRTMMAHCCAMWEAYHKALSTLSAVTAERDALRAELAARVTRPVKVRFDVTAGDVSAFIFGNSQSHKEEMSRAMHMLLHHAVIDVPPGVPTLEDLDRAWRSTSPGESFDCVRWTYERLAPYLKAPIPVPSGVPSVEELMDIWKKAWDADDDDDDGNTLPATARRVAAAIRDAVLGAMYSPQPVPAPLSVEQLRTILSDVCGVNTTLGWRPIDFVDSDIPDIHAALLPYLREPVAWELDVTPEEIFHVCTTNLKGYEEVHKLCYSRIRPVFECQECATWQQMYIDKNNECRKLEATVAQTYNAIRPVLTDAARAALEGEA